MGNYITTTGDTFSLVSRKKYGTEQEASRIARANPGTTEPLQVGTVLVIPPVPRDLAQNAPADRPDEVALLIDGVRFRFWDSVSITRSIDIMDTITFGTPFDPDAPGFKENFRPMSFKPVAVTVGGEPLFTGTMVGVDPSLQNNSKTLSVSGYSLPGVLNDCTMPSSSNPLEYNGLTLQEIATSAAGVFGLQVEFDADPGPAFERVAADPAQKVLKFLSGLAEQRNLVVTDTAGGALSFVQSVQPGNPVAILEQGEAPLLGVTPTFNPQSYYSHITGLTNTIVGIVGPQFTVKNPLLTGVLRPLTYRPADTRDSEIRTSVETKMGRMFGNVASYSAAVATWRDPSGALWEPNTTIRLTAPGAMIYNPYEFVIRSVQFDRSATSETAVLNLVLPGSFSGEIPEALPWD